MVTSVMFAITTCVLNTFSDQFKGTFCNYALGNVDFSIPRVNTVTFGKHSASYLGPVLWFKLTTEVKKSENIHLFKNRVRRLIGRACGVGERGRREECTRGEREKALARNSFPTPPTSLQIPSERTKIIPLAEKATGK